MKLVSYSREDVLSALRAFDALNKHYIAMVITEHIEALARYVPPRRKAWMLESARMGLFEAAALAAHVLMTLSQLVIPKRTS
jgi:hypothetical protein